MKDKKSPLKHKPLRYAGQSLDEEITRIFDDKLTMYILAPTLLLVITLLEWYRWYFNMPPTPWTATIMLLIAIIYSIYKIIPLRKKIALMRLGSDGEKEVAEHLEKLRSMGANIFHDIIGDGFNIDHVVVSRKGILLIETKTRSKPAKGETKITFDGQKIAINGEHFNDDILIQVRAGATWLQSLINDLTANSYSVRPIVVFPGWYVQMINRVASNTWVLNPQNLQGFLSKQPELLTEHDVQLISNHLSRYIRSTQEK